MRLTTKIMIGVVVVITIVNGAVFYFIGRRYNNLLLDNLSESARSFYKQIVVTRAWVAHYDGVYVKFQPDMEINEFLEKPVVYTMDGDTLVARNPALVTRELSHLGENMGGFRFHLTSLQPINPDNAPNDFEHEALLACQKTGKNSAGSTGEFTKLEKTDSGETFFRYFAPLYTQQACLSCHGVQGYKVGDVRGGISIIVPAQKVQLAQQRNLQLMIVGCLLSSAVITLLIFYFIKRTVIKPLRKLETATEKISLGQYTNEIPLNGNDEIGDLSKAFMQMQRAIRDSINRQIATEKMVALGQLSAGIAHEIRNPLFAVRNDLDYLKRKFSGNGEQTVIYREMEDGIVRINRTVQSVLDYSKPHKAEFSTHQVHEVIDRCMVLMEKQFAKENILVNIEIEKNLPAIEIDIHRIEQVLINLFTNAKNAMHQKQGTVELRVYRTGDKIRLDVQDSGVGIKESEFSRIFDPFYTRSKGGTGLGLTIVKRIIQEHKGEIRVKSKMGKGTTFMIELPIKQ